MTKASRNAVQLTPSLAYASGQDAGNRSMRSANRKRWSVEDFNVAAERTNRLMAYCVSPEIAAAMARDGLISHDHPALKATAA